MAGRGPTRRRGVWVALRWGGAIVGVAALGIGVSAVTAGWWLSTEAGGAWLARRVEGLATGAMAEGELAIGHLQADVLRGLTLRGVALRTADGRPMIAVEEASLGWDLWALLDGEARVDRLALRGVVVDLRADEQGVLDLVRAFASDTPAPPADPDAPPFELPIDVAVTGIDLRDVRVDVGLPDSPVGLELASVSGTLRGSGSVVDLRDLDVVAAVDAPVETPLTLVGGGRWTGTGLEGLDLTVGTRAGEVVARGSAADVLATPVLDTAVELPGLALDELDALIAPFTGAPIGLAGRIRAGLTATGPLDRLTVGLTGAGLDGVELGLSGEVTAALFDATPTTQGTLTLSAFDLADLLPVVGDELVATGTLDFETAGLAYPDDLVVQGTWTGGRAVVVGTSFDTIVSPLRLESGLLTANGFEATGPFGQAEGDASFDLDSGALDVVARADVVPSAWRHVGVPAEVRGRGRARARVRGTVYEPLQLDVDGSFGGRGFGYTADVVTGGSEGTFAVQVGPAGVTGRVEAKAEAVNAYGATIAQGDVGLDLVVPYAGDLEITGTTGAGGIAYPDLAQVLAAEGDLRVVVPAEGPLVVSSSQTVVDPTLLGFPGDGGRVGVTLVGDRVELGADVRAGDRRLVDASVALDLATMAFDVDRLVVEPTPRQSWSLTEPGRFTLVGSGVTDASLMLASDFGRLVVRGDLGLDGPLDGEVVVDGLVLDAVAELVPELAAGLAGQLDLSLAAGGTAKHPELDLDIDAQGVWFADQVQAVSVRGPVTVRDTTVDTELVIASHAGPMATLDGHFPVHLDPSGIELLPDDALDLDLVLEPGELERFGLAFPALAGLLPAGAASAVVGLHGPLRDPRIDLRGVVELDVPGWGQRGRVELIASRDGRELAGWWQLREGLTLLSDGRLRASTQLDRVIGHLLGLGEVDVGDPDLYATDLVASQAFRGLPVERVLAAVGVEQPVAGDLWGAATVGGTARRPEVAADLRLEEGRLGRVALPEATLALTREADRLGVDFDLEVEEFETDERRRDVLESGSFTVDGTLPLAIDVLRDWTTWSEGELDLTLGGPGLPLSILTAFDPGFAQLDGRVRVDGSITGTAMEPTFAVAAFTEGPEEGRDAALTYTPLGLRVAPFVASVKVDRNRLIRLAVEADTAPEADLLGGLNRGGELGDGLVRQDPDVRLSGRLTLDGFTPVIQDALVLNLKKATLSGLPDQRLDVSTVQWTDTEHPRADGSPRVADVLTVRGAWPELEIDGKVRVDRARLQLDTAEVFGAAALELDPAVVVHRTDYRSLDRRDEVEASLLDDLDVDVTVDLGTESRGALRMPMPMTQGFGLPVDLGKVLQMSFDGQAVGELDYRLDEGDMELVGGVQVVRGTTYVGEARFDVQDGSSITFVGEVDRPQLALDAKLEKDGAELSVSITGDPYSPNLSLSSSTHPAAIDQLFMLLTGNPPPEGEGIDAASLATQIALGALRRDIELGDVSFDTEGFTVGLPLSTPWPALGSAYASVTFKFEPQVDDNDVETRLEWRFPELFVFSVAGGDYRTELDLSFRDRWRGRPWFGSPPDEARPPATD